MKSKFYWWSMFLPGFLISFVSLASTLEVNINEAKMVTLPEKAKSIFISNTHIADYQPMTNTKIMVFGKDSGTASITILNDKEKVIYNRKIRVVHDTKELDSVIKAQFPEASVHSESLGGKLWLKGTVPTPVMAYSIENVARGYLSPKTAVTKSEDDSSDSDSSNSGSANSASQNSNSSNEKKLINQMVVTMPTQVNLRVRIAEVSRNVSNKLGIKWGSLQNGINAAGSFTFSNIKFGESWVTPNLNALVDALASDGAMSILAEPNLTSMAGEEANFLVGGTIPIPLIQGNTASVDYRDYGVNLRFKPTVLGPDRISLEVAPEVSSVSVENQVSVNGNVFPSFTTRRASTTIELASGQSFALGGLLQSSEIEQLQKLPGAGDIPILGSLFRSTEYQRRETELVIIATAYLVKPLRNNSLPLPTDNIIPQSDLERLLALPADQASSSSKKKTFTDNNKPRLLGDNGFYY